MSALLIFIFYQLIQMLLIPLFGIYLLVRLMKGKSTFGNFIERLGFIPKADETKNIYWFHAVSVGETLSIQSLMKKVKENIPNSQCYLTVGTSAAKKLSTNLDADYVSFLPFDFFQPMLFAFKRIKPKGIIIVEAELWPNFLLMAKRRKIPTYSINARVSNRSYGKYKFFRKLIKPILSTFNKIYVQTDEDKKRFNDLLIEDVKLHTIGNIKTFNVLDKHGATKIKIDPAFPTLLVGSIHPGELPIYLEMFALLKKEFPEFKIIFVPRHFHWRKELIRKVSQTGYKFTVWTKKDSFPSYNKQAQLDLAQSDILVACKLGVLFDLYPLATMFCLGGTFVPVGGHNLLEPAVWSKLSIVGPHYHNCKVIADKLENAQGLIKATDSKDLIRKVRYLIKNIDVDINMGLNAKKWLEKEAVIVKDNMMDLIGELKSHRP